MANFSISPTQQFTQNNTATAVRYTCSPSQLEQVLEDLSSLGYVDKEGIEHNGYRLGVLDTLVWLTFTNLVKAQRQAIGSKVPEYIAIQERVFEDWKNVTHALEGWMKGRADPGIIDDFTGEMYVEELNIDLNRLVKGESAIKSEDEWLDTLQDQHSDFYARFGVTKEHTLRDAYYAEKLPKEITVRTRDKVRDLMEMHNSTDAEAFKQTLFAFDVPHVEVRSLLEGFGYTDLGITDEAIEKDIQARMNGSHPKPDYVLEDLDHNIIYRMISMIGNKLDRNNQQASSKAFDATGNEFMVEIHHQNQAKFLVVKGLADKFTSEARDVDKTNTQPEISNKLDEGDANRNLQMPASWEHNNRTNSAY